jgi:hypothetical protein
MSSLAIIIPAAISLFGMSQQKKQQKEMQAAQNTQLAEQLAFQKEQFAALELQKEPYMAFEFTNPYADMVNPFAGMENVYEDLQVSTEAADFQMEQGAQQRANIMASLRGAAGGSGVAGLAQALAGQGTIQARQVSASLAQQQAANEKARAAGAAQVQQMERKGASMVDMARRGGEQMIQEAEMQRQSTLLGVTYQGAAGAAAGVQQSYANQMNMQLAGSQMQMQQNQMWANIAGGVDWSNLGGGTSYSNPQGNDPSPMGPYQL